MKKIFHSVSGLPMMAASYILVSLLMLITACQKQPVQEVQSVSSDQSSKHPKILREIEQVNLVADVDGYKAGRLDPNLVNAWGLTFSPTGIPWVNSNGKGLSLVLRQDGSQLIPPVAIPTPEDPNGGGRPTGIIFNGTGDFVLPNGNPGRFFFSGEDGIISGWNGGSKAIKVADRSSFEAVYKGLAMASDGGANFLYAANFKGGKIDVFDKSFNYVTSKPFRDHHIPWGYAPFNIQNIGGKLFVTYAKQKGPDNEDDLAGPGHGFVDVFNPDGTLVKRLVSRGALNSPWGITMAPATFFAEGNDDRHGGDEEVGQNILLVGNFGDGRINAYSMDGRFLGALHDDKKVVKIDGLWAIGFAPVATGSDPNKLFFTAGPAGETHGLFGYLIKE
jgi:uncharacterized protein (TIGR03118 family)